MGGRLPDGRWQRWAGFCYCWASAWESSGAARVAERKPFKHCPMCGAKLIAKERTGVLRPVCPVCDHTVYYDPKVAVVMRVTRGDEVLLVRRGVDPEKGKCALPAGFVNAGETPEDAAIREIWEETSIRLGKMTLLNVYGNPGDGTADIIIAYGAQADDSHVAHAADDADDARFFRLDALPPTAFKTTTWLLDGWQMEIR